MKKTIVDKLLEIEKEEGFKILYACETGSRAWGFPSPDSDYDVRFIYAENLDWYLSLRTRKDSFEKPISDELDITGWEFKKVLGLLWKSNAALFERLQSPIIYKKQEGFTEELQHLSLDFFPPIAGMHHYHSMSKKYYDSCLLEPEVKLKKYFYCIRTSIAGAWIRKTLSVPPIDMNKMMGIVDESVRKKIYELIELKAHKNEDYEHPREPLIDEFLTEFIKQNEAVATDLPSAKGDIVKLDSFYRKVVKGEYL